MHHGKHGSKTTSLDDSARDRLDKQPRVKAAELGFHAPDHIVDDIVTITDPKFIYSNVHAQRDRRLRLLIRRYTNQIQYGCRNVNCPTRSCWSYRKRNSTGPLKNYTELSARTLAIQLVEEFRLHGKDPTLGLCPHEPVVAWYEDPAHAKKRRNSLGKSPPHRQENGHLPKSSGLPQRLRDSPKSPPVRERGTRRTSQDPIVDAGRRLRKSDAPVPEGLTEAADILNETLSLPNHQADGAGGEGATRQNLQTSATPPKPKDLASFTQTLYDLVPLRLLEWLPSRLSNSSWNGAVPADHDPDQDESHTELMSEENTEADNSPKDMPDHVSNDSPNEAPSLHVEPAYSLSTLTWDNMKWLLSKSRQEDPSCPGPLTAFIKQSFFYCLSDPKRLVKTVQDIQQTTNQGAFKVQEQVNNADIAEDGGPEKIPPAAPGSIIVTRPRNNVRALLFGLSRLGDLGERDLVMTGVLTALQHSYALPPWLRSRRSGKHNRSGSGSSDRALSKRQQSLDSTDALNSRDSNTILQDLLLDKDLPDSQLEEPQVTELCLVAILFLAIAVFNPWPPSAPLALLWLQKVDFVRFGDERNRGLAHASFRGIPREGNLTMMRDIIQAIDVTEDWSVQRLLTVLMDVISHRLSVARWANTLKNSKGTKLKKRTIVDSLVSRFDQDFLHAADGQSSWIGTAAIELVRTVMLKSWDRSAIIQRSGPVGGALELLAALYHQRRDLALDHRLFWMPFVAEKFDDMSMPSEWLSFRADNRQMHILSFPFLFQPETLVRYFRAINITTMKKSHEEASIVYNDARHHVWPQHPYQIPVSGARAVVAYLRPHMAKFFVLTIRRDNILDDAINQIWRRQRREIMRPLRVRIGKDEGEDGLDHGGVQQEFFRLVFAEAFNPDYGMFSIDSTTRMTWFQPRSFEPLYRFEALGVLMSIAIYNGITLPLNMPLAFYRKLLGLKVKKLDHIADGWPDLAKSLRTMLEWSDGDVGDVIARTYEFSYELCGSKITVDMQKVRQDDPWPPTKVKTSRKGKEKSTSFELPFEPALTPPSHPSPSLSPSIPIAPILSRTSSIEVKGISTPLSIDSDMLENTLTEEAALVTNANRAQYVKDYILWLTQKSIEPQYEAFSRGFFTCLDRTALSMFTPEALQALIEGYAEIDTHELEKTATYEEYKADDPTIVDFWDIVHSMSSDQHRRLLEFVTASDRVPVNGMKSVTFLIQTNGKDDIRLPSSSTCYGRLLLPQYSSKEIMREKLTAAIENSVGFGQL
ncbi:hypothetical protein H2200_007306 [Cladophialophora chaetospira]|uniref:HECT-type E3 ubiquitin transferase n=1 Tax=Cladophialophora chaetospira TaxID=386627 RepID=A0AA38X858_9EURO|nr:hypothetical protein H2200_007306 [Cladophialophora chaetospira]